VQVNMHEKAITVVPFHRRGVHAHGSLHRHPHRQFIASLMPNLSLKLTRYGSLCGLTPVFVHDPSVRPQSLPPQAA
jgi:hypothetical protein